MSCYGNGYDYYDEYGGMDAYEQAIREHEMLRATGGPSGMDYSDFFEREREMQGLPRYNDYDPRDNGLANRYGERGGEDYRPRQESGCRAREPENYDSEPRRRDDGKAMVPYKKGSGAEECKGCDIKHGCPELIKYLEDGFTRLGLL